MAFKNEIKAWRNVMFTDIEREALREMCLTAFKRAGGRGQPAAIATKEILKGKIGFDDALFPVVKVAAPTVKPVIALSEADQETVGDWLHVLETGEYTLGAAQAALANYPDVLAAVEAGYEAALQARTMAAPKPGKAAPKPVATAPKPGKVGAAHGVVITRNKTRAA